MKWLIYWIKSNEILITYIGIIECIIALIFLYFEMRVITWSLLLIAMKNLALLIYASNYCKKHSKDIKK